MNFFSTHYEKVILLSFLILFIILLLLQVNFVQDVQNQKINAIMQKAEPKTDQVAVDFSTDNYKLDNVFNSVAVWNKDLARMDKSKTDLLSCFELAVCPFCNDLIRADEFPTNENPVKKACSICKEELKIKQARSEKTVAVPEGPDPAKADKNNNSVPDQWELTHRLYSSSADDIDRDHDNDGFTTWEEFKLGTNPRNAKSHPAYIDCISFERLNVNVFNDLQFYGVYDSRGENVKQWKLRMAHRQLKDRRRRFSDLTIGSEFKHGNETFELVECHPNDMRRPDNKSTYVVIRRKGTKENIRCDYQKPVEDPIKTVTFKNSHPKGTFNCKVGDTFTLGNSSSGIERYKLVSATQSQAVVMNMKTKKQITVNTVQKLRDVEARPGSNNGNAAEVENAPENNEFAPISSDDKAPRRPASRRRRGTRR